VGSRARSEPHCDVRPSRRRAARPIVSEQYSKVVGIDTHAATHTMAVVEASTGVELDQATFPATPAGLSRAAAWASRRIGEGHAWFVVEGIGTYGAGIARLLAQSGRSVVEPAVMAKATYPGRGKSDPLDVTRIAKSVLGVDLSLLRRPRAAVATARPANPGGGPRTNDHRTDQASQLPDRAIADRRSRCRRQATLGRRTDCCGDSMAATRLAGNNAGARVFILAAGQ
jgi:hypothetical protein